MLKSGKRVNALYLADPRQNSKKLIYRKTAHAQYKNQESITSGLGARAQYQTMFPENSAR